VRGSSTHKRPASAAARAHETVLYAFQGGADGGGPDGSLLMDKSGALYGTDWSGGAYGYGAVFKLTPSKAGYTESAIYSASSSADANPNGGLISDKNGALYGAGWNGSIFKLTPSGSNYEYTQIFVMPAGENGGNPEGALAMDQSGAIYGPAYYGGRDAPTCPIYGCGIIFKLTPSGHGYTETAFHFGGGLSGHTPNRPVILDQNGNIYGTTGRGGRDPDWCGEALHGCGVAFKLTASGKGFKERVIHYFGPKGKAVNPGAGLLADSTGALYGTTAVGGRRSETCDMPSQPPGCGTVFKLTPTGSGYAESVLYAFRGGADGIDPDTSLTAGPDGSLYGVTLYGGSADDGTAFKLTPKGSGYTETVLYSFQGGTDGIGPSGPLLIDSAGALYGETGNGGSGGYGTVFKITQ
jgi:uncharacterized repeat protein (TIGR03803 family)